MVRAEVILKRLNKLEEYLSILKGLQNYNYEEFIRDPEHYGCAERFLQLAIESLNDMGNHIIADLELGTVNWHRDIPTLLAENGHIDHFLEDQWIKIIGFRNTLVHDYLDIDRKIVFEVLQNNIDDFEKLKKVFAQFL